MKDSGGMVESMTPDEIADAYGQIRRLRGNNRPFDLAIVTMDPVAKADEYAAAGANWIPVTGWLEGLPGLIQAGPQGRVSD